MRDKLLLAAAILLVFAGSFLGKGLLDEAARSDAPQPREYRRIVSMAPSITETLFALGLGRRVVGVTRYCNYPPEAKTRTKVGGYHNPNFEAIVSLRADLVLILEGHRQSQPAFDRLGLRTLAVRHTNVAGILDSITQIGRACGAGAKARQIVTDIRARIARIRQKTSALPRLRVMFAIERTVGSGKLADVYVAGTGGFFDEILALAGGENACPESSVRFPVVSAEGIMSIDPDVIIDMTSGLSAGQVDKQTLLADWQQVAQVEAVRNGRVYALDQDYAFVPGPRFILLVEELARLLHPCIEGKIYHGDTEDTENTKKIEFYPP